MGAVEGGGVAGACVCGGTVAMSQLFLAVWRAGTYMVRASRANALIGIAVDILLDGARSCVELRCWRAVLE